MSIYSKVACFVGGTLFGSVGLKALATDEAKKGYVQAAALGLRVKDCVMKQITVVQENATDILASAKDLNEERDAAEAAKEAEEVIDAEVTVADVEEDKADATEAN